MRYRFLHIGLSLLLAISVTACHVPTPTAKTISSPPATPLLPLPAPLEKSAPLPELTGQITSDATHDNLSFKVRFPARFQTQSLDPNQIKYIRLWVKGYGLNQRNNQEGFVPVTNFNGVTLQVPGIPKGPNRVVVAQAYDANKQPIPAGLLKGYYSSLPDVHNITIYLTWRFTPTADVLETLINEQNPLAQSLDTLNLQRRVDQAIFGNQPPSTVYVVHPARLDAQNIAQDIKTSGGRIPDIIPPQWPTQHNLHIQVNGLSMGATLQLSVNDPASQVLNATATATNETFDLMRVAPGNWTLSAQITSATSIANGTVTPITPGLGTPPIVALPGITSFNPTSGANGSSVTITGVNFTGATEVKFNGLAATSFTVNSPTQITAVAPTGVSTGPLMISTPAGTVTSRNVFTYTPSAVITSFTPASSNSGSTVVLSGVNFTGATAVKFNGVNATYTVDNAGQITATVPTNSGSGPITVTTPVGTATSATNHTNTSPPTITSFTPTTGPIGGAVTITGTHFNGATVVKFNTTTALTYTVNSPTQITAIVPTGATTGKITVTTPQGTVLSATNFTPAGRLIFVDKDATGLNNGTNWTNAYTDLQTAYNAGAGGDEFWVAEGIYRPAPAGSPRTSMFINPIGTQIYGGFNGTETLRSQRNWTTNITTLSGDLNSNDVGYTNNGENTYHVVFIRYNTTYDGFTITGGNANGSSDNGRGGGFFNNSNNGIIIRNCMITGNAGKEGAGVSLASMSDGLVENSTITSNASYDKGGAVFVMGSTNVALSNLTISNNTASEGGGAFIWTCPVSFTNILFKNNSVTTTAGAIKVWNGATANIKNSVFTGHAKGAITSTNGVALNIENSLFHSNSSTANGGAISFQDGSLSVKNSTFFNNSTTARGGAIYHGGTAATTQTMLNNIFWGNTATLGSSQIYNGSTIATLTRNILFGNLAGIGGSATITDGGGNLDTDPLFSNSVDPDGADNLWRTNDDGLRLQGTSPALHTGTAAGAPTIDILGTARPQGADVDRGAYEQ